MSGVANSAGRFLVAHVNSRGSGVAQVAVEATSSEDAGRKVEKAMPQRTVSVVGRRGDPGN